MVNGDRIAKYSALLAATEVGLGSALHAWRVPLGGHFLSLNQGFVLSKALQAQPPPSSWMAARVSLVAATLKSFSPAGSRLTPMLAIAVQGLLFSVGHVLGGKGRLGTVLGMVALALWGFLQPVLLYMLIFGREILDVGAYFLSKLNALWPISLDQVLFALSAVVLIKVGVAVGVAWMSFGTEVEEFEKRFSQPPGWIPARSAKAPPWGRRVRLVLGDMAKPWFLGSVVLITVFAFVHGENEVKWVWFGLRSMAVGFVVFYGLRFLPLDRWLVRITGATGMGETLAATLEILRGSNSTKEGSRHA